MTFPPRTHLKRAEGVQLLRPGTGRLDYPSLILLENESRVEWRNGHSPNARGATILLGPAEEFRLDPPEFRVTVS